MTPRTQGEVLFEEYLSSVGLKADFETPIGQARPDYLVHLSSGDILCEVEDFGEGDVDRQVLKKLGVQGVTTTWVDPYGRIREKLDAAARQLREFKGQYPCVAVLYNPGYLVNLSTRIVLGATPL